MTITAGIDIGTGAVKAAVFKVEDGIRDRRCEFVSGIRSSWRGLLMTTRSRMRSFVRKTSTTSRRREKVKACLSTLGISTR